MDTKARGKALFRSKLREASQKKDKRIESPLIRYNEFDQPVCKVCNVILKSESLWPAHQASRKHREAIENVKAAAAGLSQGSKINKELQVEVGKPRSSSTLPLDFFDNKEAKRQKAETSSGKLAGGSGPSDLPHGRKEVPLTLGHAVDVPEASKKINRLANDDVVERKERNESNRFSQLDQPSKTTKYSDAKQIKGDIPESFVNDKRNNRQTGSQLSEAPRSLDHLKVDHVKGGLPDGFFDNMRISEEMNSNQFSEPSKNLYGMESRQVKGALPEGFFDNKDADLRARGIEPVKVDINDAYKEFEKEIHGDLQEVDIRLEEEEIDAADVREEFESLEQKAYREKVEMVKKQLMEFKAARLARGKKSPAFKGKESSDESSSDEDDENFAVDWRAKHF